jgi:hypothetical protein
MMPALGPATRQRLATHWHTGCLSCPTPQRWIDHPALGPLVAQIWKAAQSSGM